MPKVTPNESQNTDKQVENNTNDEKPTTDEKSAKDENTAKQQVPVEEGGRFNYTSSTYKDKVWAIIFLLHLVIMLFLAGNFAKSYGEHDIKIPNVDYQSSMAALIVAGIVGVIFSAAWLHVMKTVKMNVLLKIYGVVMLISVLIWFTLSIWMGVMGVIALLFTFFWLWSVKHRIPYAEAIIRASTQSIQDQPGPIYVTFLMAFVMLIWVGLWSLATLGIFSAMGEENGFILFLLLISLYWTAEVLKNVAHVTAAGVVAMWWFQPNSPTNPTYGALKRALTTSFGSICLGSLFVAIIRATRAILYYAREQARRSGNCLVVVLLSCIDCLLNCLQSLVEMFNVYAYSHVAVYGMDYMAAAKNTDALFKAKGLAALINDNLISMVLSLGALTGGIIAGVFAFGVSGNFGIGFAGGVIGGTLTGMVMNIVYSAVITTFVCMAEDPAALESGQPTWFQMIKDASETLDDD